MQVDLAATQRHYLDHLAPIWNALDDEERGDVIVPDNLREYAASLMMSPCRLRGNDIVLTAGYSDALGTRGWRKRALLEHGVGQTYNNGHRSYAGSPARAGSGIGLYLCPNERVADANRPYGRAEVIGHPYFEELAQIERTPQVPVASFHWNCNVAPETQSSRMVYEPEVTRLMITQHAHPRDAGSIRRHCRASYLPYINDFRDVIREASVYICDNSSTMFYAAALGIPVVILNAPWYRLNVRHGLRFWDHAYIGPSVWRAEELELALAEAPRMNYNRPVDDMAEDLGLTLHNPGAAQRAVDILRGW